MRGPRLLDLLVLGLSALSVAEANVLDTNARFSLRNGVAIQRRQQTGTGNSADPTTTSRSSSSSAAPPPPSSTSPTGPTNTPTPTPTPTPSLTPTRSSSSTPPSNTSPSATNTPPPSTTASTAPPATTESLETVTSTTVITTTNSDGQSITLTSQTTSTQTAGLANGGKGGAQNGMTPETRNTIIGVVVGVGGAIILGGLAFVAWRIWGRKKAAEENDDLMDYPSTTGGEKPDTGNSMSGRTPFQSTLESYHAPTQVNSAANF